MNSPQINLPASAAQGGARVQLTATHAGLGSIRVVANFTAQPLQDSLRRELAAVRLDAAIDFAPAGQIFQQLLDGDSGLRKEPGGVNVFLVRAEDLLTLSDRHLLRTNRLENLGDGIGQRLLYDFETALGRFHAASESRSLVVVCPSSLELASPHEEVRYRLRAIENGIARPFAQHPAVAVLVLRDFYVGHRLDLFDSARNDIAQIPFTDRYFQFIARMVASRLANLAGLAHKLIILDADGTLWQGACGEQDAARITITAAQRRLQELAKRAKRLGLLLALISKNEPADVHRVFHENRGMVLALEDFVTTRINWRLKSRNVAEIAAELNLSADSFVMIDDNPLELVEIGAAHPGVLLLPVPSEGTELDAVLDRSWLFHAATPDAGATAEDLNRTRMYADESKRKAHQSSFDDLPSFIRSLGIEVTFQAITADNVQRAAQLTARTNQFNLRKSIRSSEELQALLLEEGAHGRIVHVRDKFGDYGLTGLVIARHERETRTLTVDTLLMSCRILGRQVEHCVLHWLRSLAHDLECTHIRFSLVVSDKNAPIRDFLNGEFAGYATGEPAVGSTVEYRIALEALVRHAPPDSIVVRDESNDSGSNDAAQGDRKPHSGLAPAPSSSTPGSAPNANALCVQLCQLVQENLALARTVGAAESYFSLGGNSLKAVDLVVSAGKQGLRFALEDVLASQTIADLAALARLEETQQSPPEAVAPFALLTDAERHFVDEKYDLLELADAFPLSKLQQGMIYHSLRDTQRNLYENVLCWYVDSDWNAKLFNKALRTVQHRHEALRSVFAVEAAGRALQIVKRGFQFDLELVDLTAASSEVQDRQIQLWVEAQQARGLRLEELPWRMAVHVLPGSRLHLSLAVHHALLDGWSHRQLIAELLANYRLLLEGKLPPARAVPPSYSALLDLELKALRQDASRAFWAEQLQAASLPRWAGAARSGSTRLRHVVSRAVSRDIEALAGEWGVREKSVWCAVYAGLLAVLDGNEQTLGAVVTHSRPELDGVAEALGAYLNTLPLSCDWRGRSWREMVVSLDHALKAQFRHRFYPAAQIQFDTGLELSSSLFNFIQVETPPQGAQHRASSFGEEQTNYPLAFTVEKNAAAEQDIRITIDVDAKVCPPGLRGRLPAYIDRILQRINAEPSRRFALEDILEDTERSRLLAWNRKPAGLSRDRCVHELFERQVESTPDAIALVHEDHAISFRELNNRSNYLAQCLLNRGVGPETRIGLCFERSIEMVIGVLAVTKSGGCYVPLDPSHPLERTQFILADADVEVVLSNVAPPATQPRASRWIDVRTLLQRGYSPRTRYTNIPRERVGLHPDNLAYWLYTSGSTGRPKGVLVRHAALANLCQDSIRRRGFNGECRNLQFAPLGFDAASAEIFNSLLSGSILHLPRTPVLTDAEQFRAYSKRHSVNRGYIPPAFLGVLDKRDFSSYRSLSVGGEAIPREIAKEWSQVCTLTNAYGPTECTIACTSGVLDGSEDVSIGTFLDNVQGYVLNDALHLVPIGVVGELCIAGECLARGYATDPGLTAERFVPNPFAEQTGSRMYRTGDLVRYREDGKLEFVGRKDSQIKLRGYRIELGEIESYIATHPAIKAAVASVQGAAEDRKLVVHYTMASETDASLQVAELRAFAQQGLPHYMIPAAFARTVKIPLAANGKVDRKALAPIPLDGARRTHVAPEGECEERMSALWATVLSVERVGRFDDFFELGGHSLLATQLVFRARAQFATHIAIGDLFTNPTLQRFAALVGTHADADAGAGVTQAPVLARPAAATLVLSPAQQRLWFLQGFTGDSSVFNIPLALTFHGPLDVARLSAAIDLVIARHEALRTRFVEFEGVPRPVIDSAPRDVLQREVAATEDDLQALLRRERRAPFSLSRDRLYRFCLIDMAPARAAAGGCHHVLVITVHHIIGDGRSIGILLREIAEHYNSAGATAVTKRDLPFQYFDFVAWRNQPDNAARAKSQVEYWRGALAGLPPSLDLPLDFVRPREQRYRGATRKFLIERDTSDRLKLLSQEQGATLFMTLIAALAVLLGRLARQKQFAIGTPISNRDVPGSEQVIGLFLNMLVLRFELDLSQSFLTFLKRVKSTAIDAYRHSEVPFESLVEQLNPERSLAHTPLFQVSFSLVENPLRDVALAGVDLSLLDQEDNDGVSRYDLAFSLAEMEAGLAVTMEYNTDLFTAQTIERLQVHYRALLQAILTRPHGTLGAFEFLSQGEREQQLSVWNPGRTNADEESNVYRLIEAWIRQTPDAIAISCRGESYTYRFVGSAAQGIAETLSQRGLGAYSRVGIALERSFEMLAAVLGCLRAGVCYIPLDPSLPRARVEYIAEDAGIDLFIGDIDGLPGSAPRMSLSELEQCIRQGGRDDCPGSDEHPARLAYVIYTSGSTGRPKGVGVSHGNLINLVKAIQEKPGLQRCDRMLAVTTLSFDIAFLEVFVPLASGAVVHIASAADLYAGGQLIDSLTDLRISCMQATPSLWKLMLDAGWRGAPSLQALVGGEALADELAARLVPNVRQLWNMYGPTETTIWSTVQRIEGATVGIGRPLRNTTAYVLDEGMGLVPVGAVGELYLGGDGVACGYVNRAGLTGSRFVPNPFADERSQGSRLYRTGDLVRHQADGNLEYIGREDHQVKVRGYRIELGEIEQVISQSPSVKQTVVAVRDDGLGSRYIAAYVIPQEPGHTHHMPEEAALVSDLRRRLQDAVPSYMVPSAFVLLRAFPLTPNGKLDRAALPAPEGIAVAADYSAPSGRYETAIATVWAEILKRERVGRHDNFFELGGHSLLVTQLVARLAQEFKVVIALKELFEFPTLARIAARVEQLVGLQTADEDLLGRLSDEEVKQLLADLEAAEG